ncbi:RNA 2'-phosphotransferase [Paenibacillus sp. 32O-W]|uniref:RNA 2'-phosphotransferase n=1 Tax=Paenibacillus sp. 32O-W TaxID=1695218 RepID=UPI0011A9ECD2|nr:RNA 2'-phosphotransferase [Paenibacillus sp. 32O-W]
MLNKKEEISLSKFMTKILRHTPQEYGIVLESRDGSCPTAALLQAVRSRPKWKAVTMEEIEQVVRNSDKQRFEINGDRIRARYGHSHQKLSYEPGQPPDVLYHGTNMFVLQEILAEGLRPMGRQYVHLSEGLHFASLAGQRRGQLVILAVDTRKAHEQGTQFYYAGNEVWLADEVPADCCSPLETALNP